MDSTVSETSSARWAWAFGWALAAVVLISGFGAAALRQDFHEPDSAMRLVQVRDLLGGQAWFDNVQHRFAPPDGVPMHWARWIDLVIAAPVAALTPLLGSQSAEIIVAFLYPLALLGAFMWLITQIAGEIGARDNVRRESMWTGAIIAALAFPAVGKFAPGSFDHHNVILVLVAAAVLGLMRMSDKPRAGALAGAALAFALAIGAEAAPFVAVGLLAGGLLWLFRPAQHARGLAWLGAGLAAASLISFLALAPPSRWGVAECDTMSTPFLGLGLAGGGVALALGLAPAGATSTLMRRMAASAVLGGAALGAMLVLFPSCAGGGYAAVSEEVTTLWMAQISEARSLPQLASTDIALTFTVAGASFAGLAAGAAYLIRRWREAEGWIVLGFLAAACVVMAWQIRGAAFATMLAAPFGAWAVAKARLAFRKRPNAVRALAFLGVAGSSAAAAWAGAGDFAQSRLVAPAQLAAYETGKASAEDCSTSKTLAALNAVPQGLMFNHFSFGPALLLETKHSIVAAGYHRGGASTMAMINALRSSPDAARPLVAAAGADYVVICPALPETDFSKRHANGVAPEETLSARLVAGTPPDWLEPVDIGKSPLLLYRVVR